MSSATDSSPSRPARWLTAAAFVLPAAAWNAIRMLPRIWVQKLPFKASLWNGLVRSLMEHMPPQHIQAVFPSTLETYKAWIRRVGSARGFQERIQVTDAKRANMLWLEKVPKYDKIILFFHGELRCLPCDALLMRRANRWWICFASLRRTSGLDGSYAGTSGITGRSSRCSRAGTW